MNTASHLRKYWPECGLLVAASIEILWQFGSGSLQDWDGAIYAEKWGIHLTQVTPRCSMRPCGGLSTRPARVGGMLRQRRGLSRLSVRVALAGGFPLSGMRA